MFKLSHSATGGVKMITAVALAGLLATTLAGCASGGNQQSTKTLTIAAASSPSSFDPSRNANGGTQSFFQQLTYESLIEKGTDGSYQPGLATSWGYVAGHEGTQYEITLRSGVKFADGTPVTADAVAASLNYFSTKASGPSAGSFTGITATAEGTDKVLLTSDTPNPVITEMLTPYNNAGNIISPAGLANPDAMANATFGAGPYTYDPNQSVTNSSYVFVPNPNYYDQSRIHFDKIVIKVMSDNNAALSALQSGQIDIFVGDATQTDAAKAAGLTITASPSQFSGIFLVDWGGTVVPALGNLQVRQALNYGVDRDSIASAVFGDFGKATMQPNTPGWDAFDPNLENTYPYDPDKAKQLLAAAGYPSFSFNLLYAAFEPTTTKVVQAFAQQMSQIGVTVNLTGASDFSEMSSYTATGTFSAMSNMWGGQTQFANSNELFTTTGFLNPYKNVIDGFDPLFQAYLTASDDNRVAAGQAVEKQLVDQAVTVPIAQASIPWISSAKLQNFKLDPTGVPNNPADWTISS